jgi:A/G-specific adenine glycosylase
VPTDLRDAVLRWYALNGRPLAFRRATDAYAILVSEVLAQQTQASRAADRWERFMTRFPTVEALAAATPADVLREWQGLGYDRRGLNLWRAAGIIVERHGGRVPREVQVLESLPGVGPYTARAVAALAYGAAVGAVDTNVRRVLGRVVAGDAATLSPRGMQAVADAAVPVDRPGPWTHALMDLGATRCRPRRPACDGCPARPWCRFAAIEGMDAEPRRPGAGRAPAAAFRTTRRWLRGRVMDRLRAAPDDTWVTVEAPIGGHGRDAVDRAIDALAADGLVEVRHDRRARLRMA